MLFVLYKNEKQAYIYIHIQIKLENFYIYTVYMIDLVTQRIVSTDKTLIMIALPFI